MFLESSAEGIEFQQFDIHQQGTETVSEETSREVIGASGATHSLNCLPYEFLPPSSTRRSVLRVLTDTSMKGEQETLQESGQSYCFRCQRHVKLFERQKNVVLCGAVIDLKFRRTLFLLSY